MRPSPRALLAIISLVLVLPSWGSSAEAHLGLISPPSRWGPDVLKNFPCGERADRGGGERGTNVVTLEPGASLTIVWDEYINHPGHYRIAFDDDGQDDFMDPPCLSNCDSRDMVIGVAPGDYTDPTVLADGIADMGGGEYSYTVTLPDIECDNCTIQVIQVMTDKPPYTIPGNDMYYQCIDVVLARGAGSDGGVVVMDSGAGADAGGGDDAGGGVDTGTGGAADGGADSGAAGGRDEGGCSVAPASTGSMPISLMLFSAFVVVLRRRTRH